MQQVLTGFRNGLDGLERNDILIAKGDKNDICCQLIIDMVAENKKFFLPEKPFGEETCEKCHGLGFKILFKRELSVRTCLKCENGKKTIPCDKCQNGRYIRDKGGLRINVQCKFCHGTKQRQVTCWTCRGKAELRKMVITPSIQSTTPCKHCRELGFIDEKLFSLIDDTEKYEDAADQLLGCFMQPEESGDPEQEAPEHLEVPESMEDDASESAQL